MSLEKWILEKNLCRCCHSEGLFTNLSQPSSKLDIDINYSEMLQKLSININEVDGPLCSVTFTICEECISRLEEALDFTQQAKRCEKLFQELMTQNVLQLENSFANVKKEVIIDVTEVKVEEKNDSDDDRLQMNDDFDEPMEDIEVTPQRELRKTTTNKTIQSDTKVKARQKAKANDKIKAKQKAKSNEAEARNPQDADADKPEQAKEKKEAKTRFRLMEEDYKEDGDGFRCCRCDRRYEKINSLQLHVKTKHYKIPRFPCPFCPERFMTPAPLAVHKLKAHDVDDRFRCKACKGIFNTRVQMKKHINNFHMLGEKYKCEFCDYESFSFEGMYKHKFKHKTVKDYHCRFCRKAFLRKTTLDLHERIHTGDRRKVCTVCGKAFVQKASLNYHMTKYHPEVNF